MDISAIVSWLVEGAPGADGPSAVVEGLGVRLVAAGVTVDRVAAYVRTLHPSIMGRRFLWQPGKPVAVTEAPYSVLQPASARPSAIGTVFRTAKPVRHRKGEPVEDSAMLQLFDEGYSDVLLCPLPFLSGECHGMSYATRSAGGFTAEQVAALETVTTPLARIAEIYALRRTAANLLSTYVGRNAGDLILSGKIRRGDVDSIRAVIWFSDLRGFTSLAGELVPTELVRALNELFECQVPFIEQAGGEVLKFMGDGLFAIFPIEAGGRPAPELCDVALDMAARSFSALADVNEVRTARGARPLAFGLALHVGDVAYGNIGGSGRLDFTCIGPAVNLAARLEALASKLGRRIVVSEAFRELTTRPTDALGEFELKGVAGLQPVHAPKDEEASPSL